jgi:hypothetical protein
MRNTPDFDINGCCCTGTLLPGSDDADVVFGFVGLELLSVGAVVVESVVVVVVEDAGFVVALLVTGVLTDLIR